MDNIADGFTKSARNEELEEFLDIAFSDRTFCNGS